MDSYQKKTTGGILYRFSGEQAEDRRK